MKLSTRLLTIALIVVPAVPAAALAKAAESTAAAGPITVARYSFDRGFAGGTVAENTGRGMPLKARAADGGVIGVRVSAASNRYVRFPNRCAATATRCARALLEGGDDADLDPGTRQFRYGASVLIARSQVSNSANVMQKGIVSTESQWKLQIGARAGRAQCVVVGRGSAQAYIVRSTVSVSDSKWHKIMCMRTPTGLYIFVDGIRRGLIRVPATVSISNSLPLRIGGPNLNITSDMYNGLLDDAYVALG